MTIMKIFLSLSDKMCLMKAQPVPMRAMVMNSSAPFRLEDRTNHRYHQAPQTPVLLVTLLTHSMVPHIPNLFFFFFKIYLLHI